MKTTDKELDAIANQSFNDQLMRIYRRTDHLFGWLLLGQWILGIVFALVISPTTWAGSQSSVHSHLFAAIFLGGLIVSLPTILAFVRPGRCSTRHVIGISQMLMSALLIHLTGGRIETHFHIFGSLALLAFYRDWKVLVSASAVIAADHFFRGVFWPQSVFGVATVNHWRWLEHSVWVIFEDIFLIHSIRQGVRDLRDISTKQANLELGKKSVEKQVVERTKELVQSQNELQAILHAATDAIVTADEKGRALSANASAMEMFGEQKLKRGEPLGSVFASDNGCQKSILNVQSEVESSNDCVSLDLSGYTVAGDTFPAQALVTAVERPDQEKVFLWSIRNVSEREKANLAEKELHRQQVEIARVAGMSEIATGVLHNVGNALNSVNVAASCVQKKLTDSKVHRVADVAHLLNEQEDLLEFFQSDTRGQRIPDYLQSLSDLLGKEKDSNLSEMKLLLDQVHHIKTIVATQQSIAKPIGVSSEAYLSELVEEALSLIGSSETSAGIEIIQDFEPLPQFRVDRGRIMQILFNLVKNAKDSLRDSGIEEPKLRATITKLDNDYAQIEITDNGLGINPDKLDRIFAHGFTTKSYGHGFGLHSSANAASEMGGSLSATSDGPGKGATFRLILPMVPANAAELVAESSP